MISFELSEEQKILKDTLESFAWQELRKNTLTWDAEEKLSEDLLKKGSELGLLSATLSELQESKKRSLLNNVIAIEALAFGDLAFTVAIFSAFAAALPVALYGTREQKEKYLSPYAQEEFLPGAVGLTEPDYFFDPASMTTRAKEDASGFLLEGRKAYVPFIEEAPYLLVYALPEQGNGLEDVEAYIVPKGTAGLKKRQQKNMGLLALPTYQIELSDVAIKPDAKIGNGSFSFREILKSCYLAQAAAAVGVSRASFEYATEYAKTRVAFGEPIASRQSIAFMIAENAIEVEASRALLWEAAWRQETGSGTLKSCFQAKKYAADAANMICDRGVQILGGHGYIREHPVEMWLRNARGFACWDGMMMA